MSTAGYPTQVADSDYSGWSSDESWAEFDAYFNPPFYRAEAVKCEDIFEAAAKGNVREVRHFLREDPDSVKAEGPIGDEQPLHVAAQNGHVAVVEVLLDAGASVDAKDDTFGETPLHRAAQFGRDAVVERLLAAGASVDAVDNDGETPLHRAAQFGRDAVVEQLLAAGANIDATDNEGQTPLHRAAQFGSHTTVERLLDAGATADAVDICGMTPYQLADRQGRANVLGWFNPVWVVLGLGGNTKIRCNSHESRTVSDLKEDAEKKLGVQNIQLCPVGSFEPLTINDTPLHTKNIQPGDTIMAVVVVPPSDQQDSETDD